MTLIISLLELIAVPTLFIVTVVPFAIIFDFLYRRALAVLFNEENKK